MSSSHDLRNRPVLSMGTVMRLTELSARQIRYYEQQDLVHPKRTAGNHRLYALADVDALLEIRQARAAGFSLAKIHRLHHPNQPDETSDTAVRRILQSELMAQGRLTPKDSGPTQGFGTFGQ